MRKRLEEIENHIHEQELKQGSENEQVNGVLNFFHDQKVKFLQRLESIRMLHRAESFGKVNSNENVAEDS